jgi:hypothetical protein
MRSKNEHTPEEKKTARLDAVGALCFDARREGNLKSGHEKNTTLFSAIKKGARVFGQNLGARHS